jgi:hypothetical protein
MTPKTKPERYQKGEKLISLNEVTGMKGGVLHVKAVRTLRYDKDWDTEELESQLDSLDRRIWEEEWPDQAMLKQYLEFKYPGGTEMPQTIRVPESLIKMIQHERETERERRKEEYADALKWAKRKRIGKT